MATVVRVVVSGGVSKREVSKGDDGREGDGDDEGCEGDCGVSVKMRW